MTIRLDLYYTMRSPYCYLATPTLAQYAKTYDLAIHLKPVFPLAISDETFFERVNPLWPAYLLRDTHRIAKRLNIPFHWPRPDPIVQDLKTREIAAEQPYITRLTHFAQIAAERDKGLEYVVSVSALLFDPNVEGWNEGDHLERAMARVGLDIHEFERIALSEANRLDAVVRQNRNDQLASGHWGAPLFVHQKEIFFGRTASPISSGTWKHKVFRSADAGDARKRKEDPGRGVQSWRA